MSSSPMPSLFSAAARSGPRSSFVLVVVCTLIGAVAQVFIKVGAALPMPHQLPGIIHAVLTDTPLLFGYSLYGINAVLLVLALRKGELSRTYPVIALTYVWVTLLSFIIFREHINVFKVAGLLTILAGVHTLGQKEQV